MDYHQALMFFDAAAQLQDPQISAQAAAARDELTASLRQAKAVLRACSARARTQCARRKLCLPARASLSLESKVAYLPFSSLTT